MDNSFDVDDDMPWDDDMGPTGYGYPGNSRNDRYNKAYGDYRGGYGPGGGFGPPGFFPFGPEPDFPPGPPMHMWGRGFGPDGPPNRNRHPVQDRAARYLMRCGITRDVVKTLPKALLDLMEPHYCGLCAQHLESFTISRMHYICKNHTKNQKKWISCNNGGNQRGREIPIKSRDLYCELCDVQITSKAHALSHYAGKPHRAIVEGRKDPKNTFLLQKGMESRVQQLIRREKRSLKTVEEVEVVEVAKEPKNIPPELCCDICKTSVTCTEQMTMHLNGKRHLAKEKQHILNMMKYDVVPDQKEKADATTESPEEDAEVKDEKDEEEDKNDDWGSGGGAWEEL